MKRISRLIIISAWLFAIYPFMAGNVFSMEIVFKDPQYSFQTLRALGYAVSGGADVGGGNGGRSCRKCLTEDKR